MRRAPLPYVVVPLLVMAGLAAVVGEADGRARGSLAERMYACNVGSAGWTERELRCVVWVRFSPARQYRSAVRIVQCESVWNHRAVSRTDDHGLFQINRRWNSSAWRSGQSIYDPVWNTLQAYRFWVERGWDDWTCARIMGVG